VADAAAMGFEWTSAPGDELLRGVECAVKKKLSILENKSDKSQGV